MSSGKNGKSLFCSYKELVYVHRMSWKFLLVIDEAKEDIMEQGAVSREATEMIVRNGSLLRIIEKPVFSYLRIEGS